MNTTLQSRTAGPGNHIRGLDSIRFWCALWVYFSHFGFIPAPAGAGFAKVATGLYNNLFCGVAAVIAFFVISGFCIHHPTLTGERPPLRVFYLRRYVRILCPLGVALLLGSFAGQDVMRFYDAVMWSLVAELIYYGIYPAIRPFIVERPLGSMVAACALAVAVVCLNLKALNFHEFGLWITWIVGLPAWLLGCRLAESVSGDRRVRTTAPWRWRGAVWMASVAASVLRFHAHIGYPSTLSLFAFLVFFWIREEIRYYRSAAPPAWAESFGRWSYSMYLVHGLAVLGFARLGLRLGAAPLWLIQTMVVLLASYLFYLAIERPSHLLARFCAKRARTWRQPIAAELADVR